MPLGPKDEYTQYRSSAPDEIVDYGFNFALKKENDTLYHNQASNICITSGRSGLCFWYSLASLMFKTSSDSDSAHQSYLVAKAMAVKNDCGDLGHELTDIQRVCLALNVNVMSLPQFIDEVNKLDPKNLKNKVGYGQAPFLPCILLHEGHTGIAIDYNKRSKRIASFGDLEKAFT